MDSSSNDKVCAACGVAAEPPRFVAVTEVLAQEDKRTGQLVRSPGKTSFFCLGCVPRELTDG